VNRWGLAASVVAVVSVGSCAGASSVGDIGEEINMPQHFDDVYTFCSHGVRVFVTATDVSASSAIAVYSGPGSADCEPKLATVPR